MNKETSMSKWQRRSGIMLAYPFNERRLKKNFAIPYLVQPKLNGERCRIIVSNGNVTLLSSEENEITSVPHIKEAVEKLSLHNLELDGELYAPDLPLQKIHSIVSRKKSLHEDYGQIQFHCFDLILPNEGQFTRLDMMYNYLAPTFIPPLCIVETTPCETLQEIEALLLEYIEEGYEGIVIRDSRAPYKRKRATTMLKWKPRKSDCYQIVGVREEVDQYGVAKGTLGALICMSDDETFSVGSGTLLTRDMRYDLWKAKEKLIGQYAVIRYPELTERGIPSHPVIVEISRSYVKDEDDADSLYY